MKDIFVHKITTQQDWSAFQALFGVLKVPIRLLKEKTNINLEFLIKIYMHAELLSFLKSPWVHMLVISLDVLGASAIGLE